MAGSVQTGREGGAVGGTKMAGSGQGERDAERGGGAWFQDGNASFSYNLSSLLLTKPSAFFLL